MKNKCGVRWRKRAEALLLAILLLICNSQNAVAFAKETGSFGENVTISMGAPCPADAVTKLEETTGTTVSMGDALSVEGENSFGRLFADEVEAQITEQEDNTGGNIFSIEMSDNTAAVSFETVQYGDDIVMNTGNTLSLGKIHSGVITEDGSLYMWGNNYWGQVGNGNKEEQLTPIKVLDNVESVALGECHSGAITKDGSLYMWGANCYWGPVGNGNKEDQLTPVKVLDNVESVALETDQSGAITKDGSLYMWGANYNGQVGNGSRREQLTPVKVLDNVKSVALGKSGYANYCHSGAITKDGSLYMWGCNNKGQVGNGSKEEQLTPVKVLDNVESMALGGYHSGAITKDGSLYMWGENSVGEVGNGNTKEQLTPVKVLDNVESVALGTQFSGAITKDGSLYMWGGWGRAGNGSKENQLTPVKILDNVESVALGRGRSGAITKDGSLYMWGKNSVGEVGNGNTKEQLTPVKVLDNVEFVALGDYHGGAITKDGSLYMWGHNSSGFPVGSGGQVGNGSKEDQLTPTKILDHVKIPAREQSDAMTVVYFDGEDRKSVNFNYSIDNCLEKDATEYNPDLAYMLAALAKSAYHKENLDFTLLEDVESGTFPDNPLVITESLRNLGFNAENGDVREYNYYSSSSDNNYGKDTTAFTLATKKMSDGTALITIVVRGSYGKLNLTSDWISDANFINLGIGLHKGFNIAANEIIQELNAFMHDKALSGDNVKFVITGHSRGAAVANLVAKKLIDSGISSNNVYDYNFACPDTGRDFAINWNLNGKYDSLYNINNVRDIVGVIPGYLFSTSMHINDFLFERGLVFWGKYGRTYFFSENWRTVTETMIGGFDQHDSKIYLDYMGKRLSTDSFKSWEQARAALVANTARFKNGKIFGLFCPVDFEIIDKDGVKIAEVVNGQPQYYSESFDDVVIVTAGDQSLVYINGKNDCFIKFTGYATGEMTYCVSDAILGYEYGKEIMYTNVSLSQGKTMISILDNDEQSDKVTLVLFDEELKPVKQIDCNGTEQELSDALKEEYSDLPLVLYGDANSDGSVNSLDAVLIKRYLAGYEGLELDEATADVNGDGKVSSLDAVMILQKLAGYDVVLGEKVS